ncbi:MAG: cyanophycinase [Bacteroidota bacterium]
MTPIRKSASKGYLVLIGGAEEKKGKESILAKTLSLNNSHNVCIIPSASAYPRGVAEEYMTAFKKLGAKNVEILDIRDRQQAEQQEFIDKIAEADLIFFTGGDLLKLIYVLEGTALLEAIHKANNEGATVAGTSAGASATGDPVFTGGDEKGLSKGSINIHDGFGFIKNIAIDTRFVNRGRLGRLTQFLCSGRTRKGVGIGENTGIIIAPSMIFEVYGHEMVTVVSTENVEYSNYYDIDDGGEIIIEGIQVGFLQHGSHFNLNTWKVIPNARKEHE